MRILPLMLAPICLLPVAIAQAPAHPTAPKPAAAAEAPADTPMPDAAADHLPTVTVEFKKQSAIPGVPSSQGFQMPIVCTPGGVPVVAYPKFPAPSHQGQFTGADFMPSIYSLDPKGGHGFSPQAAPGLYDVWYRGFFVSDSMVGIEVNATTKSEQKMVTYTTPKGTVSQQVYPGAHHGYVLEFDLDGNYKKTLQFPGESGFFRIFPLPDDNFVGLVYDTVNRVPKLLLFDSDLKVLRPLEIPSQLLDDPTLQQAETGGALNAAKAVTSLSWWQVALARNRVILYHAHSTAPVLEVGAGGVLREVMIEAPQGYVLEQILPANDRWIVQFRRASLPEMGEVDARPQTGNFVFYESDPNDGSLRRRIELPAEDKDHAGGQILACERDGALIGFMSHDGQMTLYTADLSR